MEANEQRRLTGLTSKIVAAYISSNTVRQEDLGSLITNVHAALVRAPAAASPARPEPKDPAVPIRKSVTPDYILCLEDGKKFRSLKRHLRGEHGMTPEEYRAKWGLAGDYPMVAPNYAKARSDFAKAMGLGRKRVAEANSSAASGGRAAKRPRRTRSAKGAKAKPA